MQELVERFAAQAPQIERSGASYTETEARGEFIDPFLEILGWDVHNRAAAPQVRRDVVLEHSLDGAIGTGRPDYRLRHGGQDWLPVEAKKPSVALGSAAEAARQARAYGWSLSLPAAVLTNFAETVIYDATVAPGPSDGVHVAEIPGCRFGHTDYVTRFDELWERLSWDSLSGGGLAAVYGFDGHRRGESPFDAAFLEQFRSWRLLIGADVHHCDTGLPIAEVGRRTQRILNALLFLRVCEDRNLSAYQDLLNSAHAERVVEAFRKADNRFNARLFDVLETTRISASVLEQVIRGMYWPESHFAFGVLTPETLADVYEQYLGERLALEDGAIIVQPKPELLHAGGVVATPEALVDALLDHVLPEQPTADGGWTTLLDPACGSGVFLVRALERLIAALEVELGRPTTIAERGELARGHLFGLDIDGEAVEVAKLSLLLSILGDGNELVGLEPRSSVLPDLDGNIVVGNAVVGPDFDRLVPDAAADPERRASVAPSGIKSAFPDIIRDGGFTAVVGNPPYVRIQTLAEHLPDTLQYLQDPRTKLRSPQTHNFDLYQIFVERTLDVLSADGRLAFVIPHRFANVLSGGPVRELIGRRLERLVHFGELQVFPGRLTYTALVFLGPPGSEEPAIFEPVTDLGAWVAGAVPERHPLERASLTAAPWVLATSEQSADFDRMRSGSIGDLDSMVDVFVGVQTSADKLFFVDVSAPSADGSTDADVVRFVDVFGTEWSIERSILRPAIVDRSLTPFSRNPEPDRMAIFPYIIEHDERGRPRARVMSRDLLATSFPLSLEYFRAHEALLRKRSVSPDPGDAFWAYGRSQSLTRLDDPKLVVRVLSLTPQYVLDDSGLVAPGGGDGGPYYLLRPRPDFPYDIRVLQALLSHPAVDAFVAAHGKAYNGSYIVHRRAFLAKVPIPVVSSADERAIVGALDAVDRCDEDLRATRDSRISASLISRRLALIDEVNAITSRSYGIVGRE